MTPSHRWMAELERICNGLMGGVMLILALEQYTRLPLVPICPRRSCGIARNRLYNYLL